MSISRKRIEAVIRESIEETTSALVEEEVEAVSKLAAEKLVQEIDEAFDDADEESDDLFEVDGADEDANG